MCADKVTGSSTPLTLEALAQVRGSQCPAFNGGEVWLVGAGPGDPGLLTLDALAALMQADVVVYDALVDPRVLAVARPDAERLFVGKRGGQPSVSQEAITELLLTSAARGQRVVRLKGGDPFLFGRGGEEILALASAGVPYRVIPGITSGLAALSCAGIPATLRGINQAILLTTGHTINETEIRNWIDFAKLGVPMVFYMALRNLQVIATKLVDGGVAETLPAAAISSATLPGQRIVAANLKDLPRETLSAGLEGPAIVVIGEIVRVRLNLLSIASDAQQHFHAFAAPSDCSCVDS